MRYNKRALSLLPMIIALAWPTMLEQLLQTAVQYIDTAMVGTLGTAATAAVGSTTTVNWLVGSSLSALGVGFLAFVSQSIGAGNKEITRRASAQAVLVVLVVGTLFTILTLSLSGLVPVWMQVEEDIRSLSGTYFFILYLPMLPRTATIIFGALLRGAGDTKAPMRAGLLVNIINVVLNFLFIYPTRQVSLFSTTVTLPGMGWGVIGAAVASALAFAVGGISIAVTLWKHPLISPKGESIRPDKRVLGPCLKIALPNAAQRFGTSFGYVVFAAMINSLGGIATAAHTIANTVESAFYIPGYGMQAAAATLAGNAKGAKDHQRIRDLTGILVVIELLLMVLSGGLLFAFAPSMVQLFSQDAAVIALGSTVLRMVAVSEPFFGTAIILEGIQLGMGNTVRPLIYNLSGMWGIRIVGTFICTQMLHFGLVGAWACMILHNLVLFTCFVIYYCRHTRSEL